MTPLGRLPKRNNPNVDSANVLFVLAKRPFLNSAISSFNLYFSWLNIFNTFVERRHFRGCNIHHCALRFRFPKNFQYPKKNGSLLDIRR